MLEVVEAAVAAAEVVEREAAPERAQPLGERDREPGLLDQRGLGDLEHEPRRVGARALELALDVGDQPGVADRGGRDVDLDVDAAGGEGGALGDHPAVDVADRAVLLRGGQERARRDQLAVAPAHADQQLALHRLAGGEIDDRLRVHLEAVLLERPPDLAEAGDLVELGLQRRLARLALGDVDHLPEQHVDRAVGLEHRRDADRRPHLGAVGPRVALLGDAGRSRAAVARGWSRVVDGQLQQRLPRPPDHACRRRR